MGKIKPIRGTPWGERIVRTKEELERQVEFYPIFKKMGEEHDFEYEHGAQVCSLALALFDDLADVHGLEDRDRVHLMAASLLHDLGEKPGGRGTENGGSRTPDHHKKTQEIILKEGITGFSHVEEMVVSCVARYHTRDPPHPSHSYYGQLKAEEQERVRKMAALLRMAEALDMFHRSIVRDLRCVITEEEAGVTIWVFCHRPEFDWRPKERTDLFEKEFGLRVHIHLLFGIVVQ